MATPVRRTATGTPALPTAPTAASGPVPVVAPFGWLLILISGIGIILATWLLYGTSAAGMWAGYRDGLIGTVVIICAMALRTTLPEGPILAICGLCGVLLVLFAVAIDDPRTIFINELVFGVLLLAGTGLRAAGGRR